MNELNIIALMGFKLVIIDDAPFIREAVRVIAGKAGIEFVGEASDGIEAIELVLRKNPDVVLMDMVLPKKNGIDAAKEILAQRPGVRIVACSTEGQEAMLVRAMDAGCVNFISKPFKTEELLRALHAAAEKN
jgi:two-component system, chemotaxis family, chemotaxis protein CheY